MRPLVTNRLSYRLVQVTDTHMFADASHVLVGMNCAQSLNDVLELVKKEEEVISAVLLTGDASQDNSLASYQRVHSALAQLGARQYWIPGNHDELMVMQEALGEGSRCFEKAISFGQWQVLMLNSNIVGAIHGVLTESELKFLESALQNTTAEHVLIAVHHNPVPVQAAWLQRHALQNSEDLFAVLDRFPQVRGVVFGHIHHEISLVRNGVAYYGSPSTCVQFHPSSEEFTLDQRNPGYRWLELCADGTLLTGVNRVRDKHYLVDFSGVGY